MDLNLLKWSPLFKCVCVNADVQTRTHAHTCSYLQIGGFCKFPKIYIYNLCRITSLSCAQGPVGDIGKKEQNRQTGLKKTETLLSMEALQQNHYRYQSIISKHSKSPIKQNKLYSAVEMLYWFMMF